MSSSKRTENNCKIEKKKLMRKEQGSIVLFVVTSMLFFITVSFLSFNSITNKINLQKKQTEKIKEEYNIAGELDDIYEKKVIGILKIELLKQDGTVYNTNSWTNEDLILKITYPSSWADSEKIYTKDGEKYSYSENTTINENCIISVNDKNGKTEQVIIDKIDKVKPTVSLSPNGGNYTMPTSGNATIKTTLTAADEGGSTLNTLEYAWSTSNSTEPTTGWTTFTSGSTVSKTDISAAGTYYLWTKVTDKAGNRATSIKTSNAFNVGANTTVANQITLTPDKTAWTNSDVIVTVTYGANLTQNRKAGFGSADTANATSVTVSSNGTVYAEATDIVGNKVAKTLTIGNIDKTLPTVSLSPNGGDYTMPISGNATIKTTLTAADEGGSTLNTLQYAWSTSNSTEPTTGWTTFTSGSTVSKTDISAAGTYYLWTKVTDKAGNRATSIKTSNAFNVVVKSYTGYYADLNNDGQITLADDGIVYADLAIGGSGAWKGDDWSSYSYDAVTSGLNEYVIISETSEVDPFKTGKGIIQLSKENTTDRFHVMALQDFTYTDATNKTHTKFSWYAAAFNDNDGTGKLDKPVAKDYNDFGRGRANSEYAMAKWNNASLPWGAHNDDSTYLDLWGVIKNKYEKGWFLPSRAEWAAFGDYLYKNCGVTTSNYSTYGFSDWYWSSSQYAAYGAYLAEVDRGWMRWSFVDYGYHVRLGATF